MPGRADDEKFMAAAIELSRTHLGQTGTNPSVGCLIVKDGEVVDVYTPESPISQG